MKKSIHISLLLLFIILSILACKSTPTTAPKTAPLIVPAGELAQYRETYSKYAEIFVTMKNGNRDQRPNDLEELCLDWLYYRAKILEYTNSGQTDKAAEARVAFNQINGWLDQYNEDDVGTMFSIIEDPGYKKYR